MSVSGSMFGTTSAGQRVDDVVLDADGLCAHVLTFGATLRSIHLDGVEHSLTLGSDSLADYERELAYFGAVVGPVANRISGASTVIDGVEYRFTPNDHGNLLHGGAHSTAMRVWEIEESSSHHVQLGLSTASLADGLPGDRHTTARFEIVDELALRLTVTTTTTEPSLANATNHSYWNLDGSDTWAGHLLRVDADHYLPTTAETLPTGEIAPVDGTAFDLRRPAALVPGETDYDHAFCVARDRRPLTDVVELIGSNGIAMTVATTEPGVHVYDAAHTARPGRQRYEGIAIEPNGWPNSCNETAFPSIRIDPDTPTVQVTEWRFHHPGAAKG